MSWTEHKKNDEVLGVVEASEELLDTLRDGQRRWLGHVLCHDRLVRMLLEGRLPGKRGTEENVAELVAGDGWRDCRLPAAQGAGAGGGRLESMKTETCPWDRIQQLSYSRCQMYRFSNPKGFPKETQCILVSMGKLAI